MLTTVRDGVECNAMEPTLYMALELAEKRWKLGFSVGLGQRPRVRNIVGSDRQSLEREVARAKRRFGLAETARVLSCYEAGREGFWIHRYLRRLGIENRVVDSSSIEVNRRARRAKSDGLDVRKLVEMLMRYALGERRVWRVVHVPSRQDEDDRHLHRSLKTLKQERTQVGNRLRGLLKTQGITWSGPISRLQEEALEVLVDWEGRSLGEGMQTRLGAAIRRLNELSGEITALEKEQKRRLRQEVSPKLDQIRRLETLKGIGVNGAWTLVMEAFGWREFRNRRQVGGFVGNIATPSQSGSSGREQGISKAGNVWCRDVLGELAWTWVQYQPHSELTRWFEQRYAYAGLRARKIGIVAVGRKLVVQLWQFVEKGVVPPGAVFYSRL